MQCVQPLPPPALAARLEHFSVEAYRQQLQHPASTGQHAQSYIHRSRWHLANLTMPQHVSREWGSQVSTPSVCYVGHCHQPLLKEPMSARSTFLAIIWCGHSPCTTKESAVDKASTKGLIPGDISQLALVQRQCCCQTAMRSVKSCRCNRMHGCLLARKHAQRAAQTSLKHTQHEPNTFKI